MKYKVGDKVRVKSRAGMEATGNYVASTMERLAGKTVTIESVADIAYEVVEDPHKFAWLEDMFESLTLKEQYFRTGYVVERRNGNKYIVLRDGDKVALSRHDYSWDANGWDSYEDYSDDLIYTREEGLSSLDIVTVYPQACRWNGKLEDSIWQREEAKEMTIEEIEKLVGSKVKIVGNQEGRE